MIDVWEMVHTFLLIYIACMVSLIRVRMKGTK